MTVELYPNTLSSVITRTYFSDEVWVQANTGTSINANVRNVTVTSNVALGNVTINVSNHVIRFSGSYTTGYTDNVKYTSLNSNVNNSYYWLSPSVTVDTFSTPANVIVYEVNADPRSSITIVYNLEIQYSGGGANDSVSISREVTKDYTSAYTYIKSLYP